MALFVDDFFQMMKCMYVTDHKEFLLTTLNEMGWSINYQKLVLMPSTSCVFVGFNIHLNEDNGPWLQVLPEKIKKLKCHLRNALCNSMITAR